MPSFSKTDCMGGSCAPRAMLRMWRRSRVNYHRATERSIYLLRFVSSSFSLSAILPHQVHRFIDNLRSHVERGPETDRLFAGAQRKHAEIEQTFPHLFARLRIRQIEGEEHTATAYSLNKIELILQSA